MIDSWNAAKLNERITQVEKKIQANDVIANPTGEATDALEKISIDGDIYSITGVSELSGLSDVTITEPSSGDMLLYDSTSQKWLNTAYGRTLRGTSTANTSWSSQLSELNEAYNALSAAEKRNAILIRSDEGYVFQFFGDRIFVRFAGTSTSVNIKTAVINATGEAYEAAITTSISISNISSSTLTQSLALYA